MREAQGLDFDVMLEAKTKDLSLLKLRGDLFRYAPDVAARFGLGPDDAAGLDDAGAMGEDGAEAQDMPDVDEGDRLDAPRRMGA